MKKVMIIFIVLFTLSMSAQNKRHERKELRKELKFNQKDISPGQIAELQTKKMTLLLDLNEVQQNEINKLHLEIATKKKEMIKNKSERKEASVNDIFDTKMKDLDNKIAIKKHMKSILNKSQYQIWEKGYLINLKNKKCRRHQIK